MCKDYVLGLRNGNGDVNETFHKFYRLIDTWYERLHGPYLDQESEESFGKALRAHTALFYSAVDCIQYPFTREHNLPVSEQKSDPIRDHMRIYLDKLMSTPILIFKIIA